MYDRDTHAFYKEFKDDNGTDLRLEFYPAPSAPLTAPRTFVEFGDYMITSDVGGLKANFNDSIPCGRELAKSMKIKIDFAKFTGDFDLVRKWIFWGQSQTEYTTNGGLFNFMKEPFRLPNIWVLKKFKNGSWVIQYIGSQTPMPEKSLKINFKKNTELFEIESIEFWKYIGENLNLEKTAIYSEGTVVKRYIDLEFYDTNPWMTVFYRSLSTAATDHRYYFARPESILYHYVRAFSDVCSTFYFGDAAANFTFSDKLTAHWDFYKQKDSTRTYERELLTIDPMILVYIKYLTDGSTKGGFFHGEDDKSIQKTMKTAWDYIGRLADMFACKITFDYEIGKIKINPIFSHHLPKLTIDSNSIVKEDEIEIKSDFNVASKGVAHLPNELEYSWDRFGTLADTTEEIEFVFSTAHPPVLERTTTVSGIPINGINCHRIDECRLASPSYDGLYYPRKWNGDASNSDYEMMRVHPFTRVYLDTERTLGTAYSSIVDLPGIHQIPSYLDADENETEDDFIPNAKLWRNLQMTMSLGSASMWANLAATSNINQCLIPCKIEGIELRDLGRQVEIDLSLFGLDGFFTSKTVRCFLTGIEFEKVTDTIAKCEIFVSAI